MNIKHHESHCISCGLETFVITEHSGTHYWGHCKECGSRQFGGPHAENQIIAGPAGNSGRSLENYCIELAIAEREMERRAIVQE